ncbi:hypothetical protein SEA_RASPUTIA_12 [Microbacterium phage Rasputia]|nr:hypothetical protein SEA_RASPUTIA_12 [Microbacterium phage Rasputia]
MALTNPTIRETIDFLSALEGQDRPLSMIAGVTTVKGDGWDEPTYKSTVGADTITIDRNRAHITFEVRID